MKMKTKVIPMVMVALIGFSIFAPIVCAETAEEWIERGISFGLSGEHEKKIECFNKAIELNPDYAEAYNDRGNAYCYLKQYERAIEDFNKAIELNPNDALAYYNRGLAYCDLKEYERAMEDYNKAIELNPDYAEAYNNRGTAYGDLKEYERAIEDYNKAIELNPDFAGAYNNRGNAYCYLKQYERAIEDSNKARELNPNYAEAYHNREFVLSKLKEQKPAQISTPTLIGTWVGNASYEGVVIGEVRFNVSEDKIEDFTISIEGAQVPLDIINGLTGIKIGSATLEIYKCKNCLPTTIANNQFFYPSSRPHIVKNETFGVFTSTTSATGTWQRIGNGGLGLRSASDISVSPPILWDAKKVHTHLETPALSPTFSPKPPGLAPTFSPTPSQTAAATEVPTPGGKGIPGFEAIFAIAGLLAMAYLLRRRK